MSEVELVPPAYRHAPPYAYTLGPEVADLCALAGFAPDPEQELALDLIFGVGENGKSAAFEASVIVARQNMKTGLFKMCALGWLFITDQRLVMWSAHEFSTAAEAFRDMEMLIGDTPFLSKRLKGIQHAAGAEGIELKTGQRLKFKARTKAGGRGLTGDKIVLDEAFALQPAHMGALLPTLSVRPDPQVIYGSSAGMEGSMVLRRIRDRGRKALPGRLAYLEWCAAVLPCASDGCDHEIGSEGCQLDNIANWKAANPLLGRTRANGTGLTVEYVQAERDALTPAEFARERMGWWDEPGSADLFGPGNWEKTARDARPADLPVTSLAIAGTIGLTNCSIAAGGRYGDEVWVKNLRHGPRSDWVVAAAAELQDQFGVDVVLDVRGPANALLTSLLEAGVRVREVDTTEVLDACGTFERLVREDLLRRVKVAQSGASEAVDELEDAVEGAVKREVGDRWAWGRRKSDADISPLEAVTLAASAATAEVVVSAYELHDFVTI